MRRRRVSDNALLPLLAGLASVALAWWVCSAVIPGGFVPAPGPSLARFLSLVPGPLAVHAAASLARVAAALALALVSAVPAGMAIGRSPRVDRLLAPVIYVLYPVPKIALLPVLMLLFGLGDSSKVLLVFLVLFFQVLVSVRDASREVPAPFVLSLRSLGGNRWHAVRFVLVPSLVPALLSSLRIGGSLFVYEIRDPAHDERLNTWICMSRHEKAATLHLDRQGITVVLS